MAKKITPTSIPNGQEVSTDDAQMADFPKQKPIVVVLKAAHKALQLRGKPIPGFLKNETYRQKKVNWLNNFGLFDPGANKYADDVDEYEILIDQIPNAEFVVYDGAQIVHLDTGPSQAAPGKLRAVLRKGDPPIGWVG